ncbi:Slp family lipoprotein [Brenneria populi]|uniref:Slp family lipoprotein n=1 Tax=Brenneria populi TaxID=1505588 RepID=UPI00399A036C
MTRRMNQGRRRIPRAALSWACGAAALLLAGCVTVPDAIKGASPTPQDDLVRVMSAPQLYVGQASRFGGRVVGVRNEADKTRLEIVSLPLDSAARPRLDAPSEGRFIAYVNRFLEPVDFQNRLVTVVGPITGTEQGAIGDRPYRYVVVEVQGYQRWNVAQRVVNPYGPGPWGWRGRYGWGPGWGPDWGYGGWYGPAEIETFVTE